MIMEAIVREMEEIDNEAGRYMGNFDEHPVFVEPLPPLAGSKDGDLNGEHAAEADENGKREIVLGRNVHTTCYAITEPFDDEDFTGDKEAYMASILARYRMNLIERTRYHLGFSFFETRLVFPFARSYSSNFHCSDLDLYFPSSCFRLPL